MRIGVGVGPVYASTRVNPGCSPGCLLTFALTVMTGGGIALLAAGINRGDASMVVWGGILVALVVTLLVLVVRFRREARRLGLTDEQG